MSLPVLPVMAVIIMEGLYGGLNRSVVPEICSIKLGGILYGVQGTGFKAERRGVEFCLSPLTRLWTLVSPSVKLGQ